MNNYSNALVEVDTILENLNEKEFQKIPPKIINAIKKNKNLNYEYNYNNNIELKSQPMLPETKAILFNIFRDYLSTPEQKEKIINMQTKDRIQAEERKRQEYKSTINYDIDNLLKKQDNSNTQNSNTKSGMSNQIVQYKESIFSKIIYKLKSIIYRR